MLFLEALWLFGVGKHHLERTQSAGKHARGRVRRYPGEDLSRRVRAVRRIGCQDERQEEICVAGDYRGRRVSGGGPGQGRGCAGAALWWTSRHADRRLRVCVYDVFPIQQRCWIYIREAEKYTVRSGGDDLSCYRRLLYVQEDQKPRVSGRRRVPRPGEVRAAHSVGLQKGTRVLRDA